MDIKKLCAAVESSLPLLARARTGKVIDHSLVEDFQESIKERLNESKNGYTWDIEQKAKGRSERDSIDIWGLPSDCVNSKGFMSTLPEGTVRWIIEIDATRSDQVSQKFLSRVALWGLKEPIRYVAILYPDTQNGKSACEKYLRYCNDILQTINDKSSVEGIFVVPGSNTIEVLNFSESSHFKVNDKECKSMSEACAEAIRVYMNAHPGTYAELKQVWDRYVEDAERSRAKSLNIETTDGVTVYHYTQFRQYGPLSYWPDFVSRCKKHGITITKLRKLYRNRVFTYEK